MSHPIIETLLQHKGEYVSGERLSQELGVSRTAIWKQIKKLEAAGYRFEASRKLGYRLVGEPPAKLQLGEIVNQLKIYPFVKAVKLFDSVQSTQNIAQQLAEDDAPEGTIILAEEQTNGRGRRGRIFLSPAGSSVSMSIVLRPDLPLQFAPQLTLLAAVALCRGLRELTGLDIGIKWPNDLQVDGKKISGILMESTAENERIRYVIAGIGIGVNLLEEDYPAEMRNIATSLRIAKGEEIDRLAVIVSFIKHFTELYPLYLREGFGPIISLWESMAVMLHKKVKLSTSAGIVEGVPIGLCESGALLVKKADGSTESVFSAESLLSAQETPDIRS
ncbi:biotin--[acetyl-CoA-carboxylase] ligase [Paenibacillus sp. GCM10027626]|uniref:biotin--[acetyl-CoA-carboxylase] ligase n=1 Tax=Paenibacillus sp. GCM10027626 TaxID=3273411 RepID=UPI0036449DFC